MIKNILVRNIFFCLCLSNAYIQNSNPTAIVPDLSDTSVTHLRELLSKNKTTPFVIHVQPDQSWYQACTTFFSQPYNAFAHHFTLASLAKKTCTAALSLGWISYVLCLYIIYRVYRLLSSAASWINWCSDDQLLLADDEALYQKLAAHRRSSKKSAQSIQKEIAYEQGLLTTYFKIDTFLKKHKLRHFFPFSDEAFNDQLQTGYAKLVRIKNLTENMSHQRNFN